MAQNASSERLYGQAADAQARQARASVNLERQQKDEVESSDFRNVIGKRSTITDHTKGAREAAAAQIYYDGMKRLSLKEKRTETIKSELEARQKEEEKQNTFQPTIFTAHRQSPTAGAANRRDLIVNSPRSSTSPHSSSSGSKGSPAYGKDNSKYDVYDWLTYHSRVESQNKFLMKRDMYEEERAAHMSFSPKINHSSHAMALRKRQQKLREYATGGVRSPTRRALDLKGVSSSPSPSGGRGGATESDASSSAGLQQQQQQQQGPVTLHDLDCEPDTTEGCVVAGHEHVHAGGLGSPVPASGLVPASDESISVVPAEEGDFGDDDTDISEGFGAQSELISESMQQQRGASEHKDGNNTAAESKDSHQHHQHGTGGDDDSTVYSTEILDVTNPFDLVDHVQVWANPNDPNPNPPRGTNTPATDIGTAPKGPTPNTAAAAATAATGARVLSINTDTRSGGGQSQSPSCSPGAYTRQQRQQQQQHTTSRAEGMDDGADFCSVDPAQRADALFEYLYVSCTPLCFLDFLSSSLLLLHHHYMT
jgi:hypothetical protein